MTYPSSFKNGEFGFAPGAFFGGPFDGARYRLPVLPDGEIPANASLPTNDHAHLGVLATYARHGDETIGGYYVYLFECYRDADGNVAAEHPGNVFTDH